MSECIGEAEVGAGAGGGRSSHNKCHCESRKNPQLTSSLVPLLTGEGGYFCQSFYVDPTECSRCLPPRL